MTLDEIRLNHRERATLQAVAEGRAEMSCSREPDLFIDGLTCCDQFTAHRLAKLALVAPGRTGQWGERVPATITDAARAVLLDATRQLARPAV